jgi:hypothetical protein
MIVWSTRRPFSENLSFVFAFSNGLHIYASHPLPG